jgi:hypothetical protein
MVSHGGYYGESCRLRGVSSEATDLSNRGYTGE